MSELSLGIKSMNDEQIEQGGMMSLAISIGMWFGYLFSKGGF